MLANPIEARLVLTTAADKVEAERLARTLVDERLIACASLVPGIESIYHWKGAVEQASEILLLMKTTAERIEALEARLHALHSYETPEFLVLDVAHGSRGHLDWLADAVRGS